MYEKYISEIFSVKILKIFWGNKIFGFALKLLASGAHEFKCFNITTNLTGFCSRSRTKLCIPSLHVWIECIMYVHCFTSADCIYTIEVNSFRQNKICPPVVLLLLTNIIPTILVFHSIPHHLRAYWKGKFKETKFNPKQIDRHDGDREHLLKHDEYI